MAAIPWRTMLGILAVPALGYGIWWGVFVSTLGPYSRLFPPDPESVGVPPDIAIVYLVVVPILAAAVAGAAGGSVSRSGGRTFRVCAGLAAGLAAALPYPRWWAEALFWGFCVAVAAAAFLGASLTTGARRAPSPAVIP